MKFNFLTLPIVFLGLLSSVGVAKAQFIIKGSLENSQKQKKSYVHLFLLTEHGKKISTSDSREDGSFTLQVPDKGTYILDAYEDAFTLLHESVKVERDTVDIGRIIVSDSSQIFQTIEIVGNKSRKYFADYSFSATRISMLNQDVPQAISVVTKELIADKQAFTVNDALMNVSSVSSMTYGNVYSIRGMSSTEEGTIINGMRTRQYSFMQPLTNNLERIEVIKGPASATFSSASPGGSVNLVTKKPLAENRKEIMIAAASFADIRSTLDFTGPLNNAKSLLYRLNIGYQNARSFRELQNKNAVLIAPSFSFIPNANTKVNVELIFNGTDSKLDRGQAVFGGGHGRAPLYTVPITASVGFSDDFYKTTDFMLMTSFTQKFTPWLNFNAMYMKQMWNENLQESRPNNTYAVDSLGNTISSLMEMRYVRRRQSWDTDNFYAYFDFHGNTGKVNHQFIVGYDLLITNKMKGAGSNTARRYRKKDGTIAKYDKNKGNEFEMTQYGNIVAPKPNVPHFDLVKRAHLIANANNYIFAEQSEFVPSLYQVQALYFQEVMKVYGFTLVVGLRNEWYTFKEGHHTNNEKIAHKIKLLPRVGLTYKINKHINVYSTYLEGYQPAVNIQDWLLIAVTDIFDLKPITSNLKEVGLKSEWLGKKLVANIALFDITKRNIIIPDASEESFSQKGAERSMGVELEAAGQIFPNWRVNFNYSFMSAKIISDADPLKIGKPTASSSKHIGNFWTRYDFARTASFLKGIGIGGGVRYVSSKVPFYSQAFTLPGVTIVDAAIYYQPTRSNFQLSFNANNIFGKTYWVGALDYYRLFPGMPRNFVLGLTYKF